MQGRVILALEPLIEVAFTEEENSCFLESLSVVLHSIACIDPESKIQSFYWHLRVCVCAELGDQSICFRAELPFREIQMGWRHGPRVASWRSAGADAKPCPWKSSVQRSGLGTSKCWVRGIVTSLSLQALLLVVQPGVLLSFPAAMVHSWLLLSILGCGVFGFHP